MKKQEPKLTHLLNLTDDFGVWQHFKLNAIFKEEGYALDDSARALIVYLLFGDLDNARTCLTYLKNSLKEGKFVGFFDQNRNVVTYPSSDDAMGLAYWALSYCVATNFEKEQALILLSQIDKNVLLNSDHLRPQVYMLIGLSLQGNFEESSILAKRLVSKFNISWGWFEGMLTYANAVVPYGLLHYFNTFKTEESESERIVQAAVKTLETVCYIGRIPAPIGNKNWHVNGNVNRDIYGQQPIDAAFMVLMYCEAYRYYDDKEFLLKAQEWFDWFWGNNIFKESFINDDFGCADGLDPNGLSKNFGAESTIMFLWASKIYATMNV